MLADGGGTPSCLGQGPSTVSGHDCCASTLNASGSTSRSPFTTVGTPKTCLLSCATSLAYPRRKIGSLPRGLVSPSIPAPLTVACQWVTCSRRLFLDLPNGKRS